MLGMHPGQIHISSHNNNMNKHLGKQEITHKPEQTSHRQLTRKQVDKQTKEWNAQTDAARRNETDSDRT